MQQPATPSDSGPTPSSKGLAPGDSIADDYVVEHAIGSGGMGEVVAARPAAGGELVAIKVMLPRDGDDAGLIKRFLREARTIAAIDSPHVARLIDSGTLEDGRPFLVLELLEGEGVEELIRRRAPLPIEEAVGLVLQACEGVAEVHARGIVHRDLKPSNLYCCATDEDEPLVKVLDFGIAKLTLSLDLDSAETSLTKSDSLLGSPQYMSPEQIRAAREVDGRTDIWALGVILFKLLTGKLAFDARTVGEHFAMVLSDEPTALRSLRPEAPAALERIIVHCLKKTPSHRFRDVASLASALCPMGPPSGHARAERIQRLIDGARASVPSLGGARTWDDDLTMQEPDSEEVPMAEAPTLFDGPAEPAQSSSGEARESAPATGEGAPSPAALALSEPLDEEPSADKRPARLVGAALIVAALALGVWLFTQPDRGSTGTAAATDASAASATTAAGGASAEAALSPSAVPGPISLRLRITPPDARVELDGTSLAHEEPITLPYDEGEHHLVVSAPGHVISKHTFAADRDRYLEVILDELPAPSARPAPPPRPATPPPPATVEPTSPPPPATAAPIDVGGPIEETL